MSVTQTALGISKMLKALGDPAIAKHSKRFFKTGKGQYGEGDQFLGIRVPVLRREVKKHTDLSLPVIQEVLKSGFHEARLFALLLLVQKFANSTQIERKAIYDLYLASSRYINNWDLVDSSAHQIIGGYLEARSRRPLYRLARSNNLWERRVSIIATLHFIRSHDFSDTLAIAEILLDDDQDLIHKATGWMLREVGNRDKTAETAFLNVHYKKMPRTMLRYAIEKLPEKERLGYLNGDV